MPAPRIERRHVVATETVRYGDHSAQFAELSRPAGDPRGVAVLVHGGFWKPEYGIEYARPLVPSLVAAGWLVWAVEYRRGTGAADTLADVRAAIAARPDVDGPVVGIGHSAGGHLAVWAAGQGVGLTHVISQAGVLDLRAAHEDGLGDGAVERFLGHPPGPADDPADPIRNLPLGVPVWCVHARGDDIVPISQSEAYVAAATAAGSTAAGIAVDPAELIEVDGDHFTVIDPHHPAWTRQLDLLATLSWA